MFYGAHQFNQHVGDWDVSYITNMISMFAEAHSFNANRLLVDFAWIPAKVAIFPIFQ